LILCFRMLCISTSKNHIKNNHSIAQALH
jgi:hypothetical protein